MAKYRRIPIVIEAEVYEKGMEDGFGKVLLKDCFGCDGLDCNYCSNFRPYIITLQGKLFVSEGDYIITDMEGERYPCKPNIFNETYERID